jgi:hypothetical protein
MVLDHEDIILGSICMGDSRKWLCGTKKSCSVQFPHTNSKGCLERLNEEGWKGNILYTSSHA